MTSIPSKEWPKTPFPKTLVSVVCLAGGLAFFVLLASFLLISRPVVFHPEASFSYSVREFKNTSNPSLEEGNSNSAVLNDPTNSLVSVGPAPGSAESSINGKENVIEETPSQQLKEKSFSDKGSVEPGNSKDNLSFLKVIEEAGNQSSGYNDQANDPVFSSTSTTGGSSPSAPVTNLDPAFVADSDCDLYHGKWVYDSAGPLYKNDSCPIITQMQNCQGNGRPDKDYENWRWKPAECDLPRFDPKMFLKLMKNKTLAFIGDSVARNQFESMLCILWQVEEPRNKGNRRMQRYYFRSTSTMIVRIWSSWLVHQTSDPFDSAPAGVAKLYLDAPDEVFMQYITDFDVTVLSSGHWFAKQSVYILNSEIVGGQLWWPDKQKKIDNVEAFSISVETILTAMVTQQNYTGLTIVRSFSPDHYEGGEWNTGGSCTGKVMPAREGEMLENPFTSIMHKKQVIAFESALKKKSNKSKLKMMDITEAFSYRHDGHPGPYRSLDPNKITARRPDGRPPPQDCLHWCMPGPVDTWNELVLEIIRKEFEDK